MGKGWQAGGAKGVPGNRWGIQEGLQRYCLEAFLQHPEEQQFRSLLPTAFQRRCLYYSQQKSQQANVDYIRIPFVTASTSSMKQPQSSSRKRPPVSSTVAFWVGSTRAGKAQSLQ